MRVRALISRGPDGWCGNDKDLGERASETGRKREAHHQQRRFQSLLKQKGHDQREGHEGGRVDAPDVNKTSVCR